MAGSYAHLTGEGGGLSMIENMRDAAECIEELFYLVRSLACSDGLDIDIALDEFHRYERGELEPMPEHSKNARAYLATKEMMER